MSLVLFPHHKLALLKSNVENYQDGKESHDI
jgi:hypothetical protein